MNTTIFYFSGTGNSQKVAKDIATELNNAEVVSIADSAEKETICDSPNIGFVFPVYSFGLPVMVAKFIKKLKASNSNPYFFAFSTYRDKPGGAIFQTQKLLKSNGYKLSAGFNICMPGNYLLIYEADTALLQKKKFKLLEESLNEKIELIKDKNTLIEKTPLRNLIFQFGISYPIMAKAFRHMDRLFWVDENCNGCAVCKRVCPADNIVIKDNKPVFLHKCEQCVACINWCPTGALQCTKKTIGRQRYHHPDIKLNDIR